jgi:hypothetical protein
MTVLTDRFARAVDYARVAHAAQVRKGTNIPYITHLLGVATLVIEYGGSEDQAIAGLLHDTIEDCGEVHEAMIRAQFGETVARIVRACTDGTAEGKSMFTAPEEKKADWLRRKQVYLAHLAEADDEVLLVPGCDKLHNAQAIVVDLENPDVGDAVFDRFKSGREGTLQYYESLVRVLESRGSQVARRLDGIVARMHLVAGNAERKPLNDPASLLVDAEARISQRFWFKHVSGERLYPYKSKDQRTGRLAFRVAPGMTGANRVENQTQLDDVEEVYRHVFGKGWSVRLCSLDRTIEGLYSKDGYSIVSTSKF